MNTLGINCACRVTNVGIASNGAAAGERNIELGRRQSAELPRITAELLKEVDVPLSTINLIAVGVGPGYYTGIRAGIAYGAALAEALHIPVVPLSSLQIFIWDIRDGTSPLMPIFRAKRLHCYAALYTGTGEQVIAPAFMSKGDILRILEEYRDVRIVTPDAERYEWLQTCDHAVIERASASGATCALMGEHFALNARCPREIRGEYLRAPDIGPTGEL